jgi:hypothetical protein
MSNLDNFHPFRQSVNLRDSSSSNNQPSSGEANNSNNNNNQDEKEYIPFFSWKTKFRLLIFGLAASVLLYVLSSAIDSFSSDPSGKSSQKSGSTETAPPLDQIFDKNDLNERGREVSHARKKAGIFAAIFCKGGKRSRFCDN